MKTKLLYKYRPINNDLQFKFVEEILLQHKLFISDIYFFSDPFDAFQKNFSVHKRKKLLSFTEEPDNKLLWAFYGGWYSGVMIEFEINLQYSIFNKLKKISYVDDKEIIITNSNNLYIKPIEFEFEKEWRLIHESNKTHIKIPKSFIKSITLGPSLNTKYKIKLQNICKEMNITILEYKFLGNIPMIFGQKSKKIILQL